MLKQSMKTQVEKFCWSTFFVSLQSLPKTPIIGATPFEIDREQRRIYARGKQPIKGNNAFTCHSSVFSAVFLFLTITQSIIQILKYKKIRT